MSNRRCGHAPHDLDGIARSLLSYSAGGAIEDADAMGPPAGSGYWVDPGTDQVYPLAYRAYRQAREAEEKTPARHRTLGPDVDYDVWRRGLARGLRRPRFPSSFGPTRLCASGGWLPRFSVPSGAANAPRTPSATSRGGSAWRRPAYEPSSPPASTSRCNRPRTRSRPFPGRRGRPCRSRETAGGGFEAHRAFADEADCQVRIRRDHQVERGDIVARCQGPFLSGESRAPSRVTAP